MGCVINSWVDRGMGDGDGPRSSLGSKIWLGTCTCNIIFDDDTVRKRDGHGEPGRI